MANESTEENATPAEHPRHLCVHCGHRFQAEEQPERCPSCMRKGGIETLADQSGERPGWLVPAAVVAIVAVLGGGYAYWNQETPDPVAGEAPLAPLDEGDLRDYLAGANGAPNALFEGGEAIAGLAESATGTTAHDKAAALTEAIRSRFEAGAFVRWSLDTPRDTELKNAEETAAVLAGEGRAKLYPLEVAAAAVAALREAGVPAMLAETWAFPGDRQPPDPSGHIGYFQIAVYDDAPGEGEATLHDPFGGHSSSPAEDAHRILSDPQAIAAAWNLRALHLLVQESEAGRALDAAQTALRLDRRAPYIRSVRGAILMVSGGLEEGFEEIRSAAQIRGDAPRRNLVAGTYLASGNADLANREVAAALQEHPDFAAAHATLAAIHLENHETDEARQSLQTADRLEPDLNILPMLWAQLLLTEGEPEEAMRRAADAVAARPHDANRRLQAAQIFRAGGDIDEMRRQARQALELSPADSQAALRQHILQALGRTALDEPLEDEPLDDEDFEFDDEAFEDEEGDDLTLGGGGLRLGSSLLGEDGHDGSDDEGPSLLEGNLGGGDDGPALMLGNGSNYGLGGGGQLRLDL